MIDLLNRLPLLNSKENKKPEYSSVCTQPQVA